MPITALYASLLLPLFLGLAVRVVRMRGSARIALGDGGDGELLRRTRAHENFGEYAPYAPQLMGLAESLGLEARALHAAGLALLLGRASHAFGVSQRKENLPLRKYAMLTTTSVMAAQAAVCFYLSMRRNFGL